ncbi:MAG: DUF4276 family protein [Sulfuricurvum sp.]
MKAKIYVEGGAKNNSQLNKELRMAFSLLFDKLGIKSKVSKIIASGSRSEAFGDFKAAIKNKKFDEVILLLVDSEGCIDGDIKKWDYVKTRVGDNWEQPKSADEDNLFFMIECMESWFLADKDALKSFYGKDFHENALPKNTNLESTCKQTIYNALENATKDTTKGTYGKGAHSFKILGMLDANKVKNHGKHSKEFFEYLEKLT